MALLKTILFALLFFICHTVDGYRKVITVDESVNGTEGDKNQLSCCVSGNCTCHSLLQALKNVTGFTLINITSNVNLTEIVPVKHRQDITIVGLGNIIKCNNVGGVSFESCSNITIEHLTWDRCGNRKSGPGGEPALEVNNSTHITVQNCTIQNSNNQAFMLNNVSGLMNIIQCRFVHNRYLKICRGIAIQFSSENQYFLTIRNCDFIENYFGASVVYIEKTSHEHANNLLIQDCNFTGNKAVPFSIVNNKVTLAGNLLFRDNIGKKNGGSMELIGCSIVKFINCRVIFERNTAETGGAIYTRDSKIAFEESSTISFDNNSATQHGGALYLNGSTLLFKGYTSVHFRNNSCSKLGGALYLNERSIVTFEGNTISTFTNNSAEVGGAIHFTTGSLVMFTNNSNVSFSFNKAQYGAGSWCIKSRMTFTGNSKAVFSNGEVATTPNTGGGVGYVNCIVRFIENTTVLFENNTKSKFGGGIFCNSTSDITFGHNSRVIFSKNQALLGGGFRCAHSNVTLDGNTSAMFTNNVAKDGGAVSTKLCNFTITESSSLTFTSNRATRGGGAMNAFAQKSTSDKNSSILFINNTARIGGAVYFSSHFFRISGNSNVSFHTNVVSTGGGAICLTHSNITMSQYSMIVFNNNSARNGGAIRVADSSIVIYEEFTSAELCNNKAQLFGGAMHVTESNVTIASKSVKFSNNMAVQNGGALYFRTNYYMEYKNSSKLTFYGNNAEDHGGAAFCILDEHSFLNINTRDFEFHNNNARFGGNSLFVKVPIPWNTTQLQSKIKEIHDSKFLTTSGNKLALHSPATPIDDINGVNSYYIPNIMLGQEIIIDGCVLDYFNQTGNVVPFLISTDNCTDINSCQDHYLDGQNMVTIMCTKFQDISVAGKKIMQNTALNYSIALTSHFTRDAEWKKLLLKVIIELVPCHPGFWYSNEKCECFTGGDVISCFGSNSVIKRGYWFGTVDGQPTVTVCPYSYCNFSCCQTTTGFNNLSPQRSNQCRSHRSGTACGSCEDGYTLSFDSIECVDVNKCTTGQAVLVTVLTVTYWIAVVVVVFIMMYYKVGIQYLYGITYYYSMIDILLLPNMSTSHVYTAISVMSSFAKIIPQFLGQFCFFVNLNGIDQQFIHYIHPLAVSFLLVIICLVARCSVTFSAFISKGIIQALCFLLLLSYTSIATTSLVLIRPLTFYDIEKTYTYLSPEIEYFHGRHLLYAIIAMICIIVIVIGLPLLLLLEPFINRKINFIRIKPLLDQFQGCYKDKYRFFSAYYMICRQVLIVILIADSSDDLTSRYLLVAVCTFIALIHLVVRPYASKLLNILDGIILHFMILVVGLSQVAFDFSSQLSIAICSVLLATPLSIFIVIKLLIHKNTIKKIFLQCKYGSMRHHKKKETLPSKDDIDITIDDSMRRNATICDISELERYDDTVPYRESFMEIMDDIKD